MEREVVCPGFHWTDEPKTDGMPTEVPHSRNPSADGWGLVLNINQMFLPDVPDNQSVWLCPECIRRFNRGNSESGYGRG
jgi:hypothetical protein